MDLLVLKVLYTPMFDIPQPLTVHIVGVDRRGKKHRVDVLGTRPRLWVREDPRKVEMGDVEHHIERIEYGVATDFEGNRLNCVYVDYPWAVPLVREKFQWTGQADIKYYRAVRYYHGIGSYIRVPDRAEYEEIDVSEIESIEGDWKPDRIVDWDIETDDSIHCMPDHPISPVQCYSLYDRKTRTMYHRCAYDIDPALLEILWSSKTLAKILGVDRNLIESVDDVLVKVKVLKNEMELFKRFDKDIRKINPSVITGWNVKDFDAAYLEERARRKREKGVMFKTPNFSSVQILDLMSAYSKMIEGEMHASGKFALQKSSEIELGFGKIKWHGLQDQYGKGIILSLYNMWDAYLCYLIDAKLSLSEYYITKSIELGVEIRDVMYPTITSEAVIARRIGKDRIAQTRRSFERNRSRIVGGLVPYSPSGVYRNVIELDNSRQYPSVIMTCCIDPTTKLGQCEFQRGKMSVLPSGRCYLLDERAPLPSVLKEQARKRSEYKLKMKGEVEGSPAWKKLKLLDKTSKEIMNSFYGVFGNPGFVYYDPDIANDITAAARAVIEHNKRFIESMRLDMDGRTVELSVIYIDTDSCKCVTNGDYTNDELWFIANEFSKALNDSYDEFAKQTFGVSKHYFNVKVETVSPFFICWGRKKRYVQKLSSGRIDYKGLDVRRSDSSVLTKRIERRIFEDFFDGKDVLASINEEIRNLRLGKIDADTQITKRVNSVNNHLYEPMLRSNEKYGLDMRIGDRVGYYYTTEGIVVVPVDDPPEKYGLRLDYEAIISKEIKKKIEPILSVFGIPIELVGSSWSPLDEWW